MSDYIGILIGATVSAILLLIVHFIERAITRTKSSVKGSFPIAERVRLMRISESKKLCDKCKGAVSKLDSLEPFDYGGIESVVVAFPVYDDSGEFYCHEMSEYRDAVKPSYYGLCGTKTIREFKSPQSELWMYLGVVKKEL